jgi:hypothetical protein
MRKLYLPLRRIRRLAFYQGINTVPRAFVCSFLALCDHTFLCLHQLFLATAVNLCPTATVF